MQYYIYNVQHYEEAHENLPEALSIHQNRSGCYAGGVNYDDWEQPGLKHDLSPSCW